MKWANLKIYGALTIVSLLYGVNYSVLKIVIPEHIGAFGFIVYRVGISAALFWLFSLFSKGTIDWKADGIRIVLCAITGVVVNQLLFFKGISMTSAVNGSIIMTLVPVFVLIWSSLLLKERITSRKIIGILIGLVGAIIIIYNPAISLSQGNWKGDLLILFNGLSYSCYLVLVKPLMSKYNTITIIKWVFTLGTPLVILLGFGEAKELAFTELPLSVWLSAAYTIIGVTVVVYFLNMWTLKKVNPSVVGSFAYFQPVFATATAILFFGEQLTSKHIIASFFVFLGVWLVTKKRFSAGPR